MFTQPLQIILSSLTGFVLFGVFSPAYSSSTSFIDSASIEYGQGNKTNFFRAALQHNWESPVAEFQNSRINAYWDLSLSQWRGTRYQQGKEHKSLTAIGITPVFRWQTSTQQGFYGEFGIGAYLLSDLYDNNGRRFSTHFQFGDHLAAGYQWSQNDLQLRLQHFSNARIKEPNPGINFISLRYTYHF